MFKIIKYLVLVPVIGIILFYGAGYFIMWYGSLPSDLDHKIWRSQINYRLNHVWNTDIKESFEFIEARSSGGWQDADAHILIKMPDSYDFQELLRNLGATDNTKKLFRSNELWDARGPIELPYYKLGQTELRQYNLRKHDILKERTITKPVIYFFINSHKTRWVTVIVSIEDKIIYFKDGSR